jgi:hypothetical protein
VIYQIKNLIIYELLRLLQRFEMQCNPEKFLKVPRIGTFKNFLVPFTASTGCKQVGVIKNRTQKAVAHAARAPQLFGFYI